MSWPKACYTNTRWFFVEVIKMYSNQPSFFSKKRIESGISFIIAQCGMIYFFVTHVADLSMGEFLLWASAEFAVAGYIVNQIQNEKVTTTPTQFDSTLPPPPPPPQYPQYPQYPPSYPPYPTQQPSYPVID